MEEKKYFELTFQLSKMNIFEVKYYILRDNKEPYFATCASIFIRNKKDFDCCGQAQERVTKDFPTAREFYEKWDKHHLHKLTDEQYTELINDLKPLMDKYNFIPNTRFYDQVMLSKLTPKNKFNTKEKWETYMQEQIMQNPEIEIVNKW